MKSKEITEESIAFSKALTGLETFINGIRDMQFIYVVSDDFDCSNKRKRGKIRAKVKALHYIINSLAEIKDNLATIHNNS